MLTSATGLRPNPRRRRQNNARRSQTQTHTGTMQHGLSSRPRHASRGGRFPCRRRGVAAVKSRPRWRLRYRNRERGRRAQRGAGLTLDAWGSMARQERNCASVNRSAELTGAGEGNGTAGSIPEASRRFLAQGCSTRRRGGDAVDDGARRASRWPNSTTSHSARVSGGETNSARERESKGERGQASRGQRRLNSRGSPSPRRVKAWATAWRISASHPLEEEGDSNSS